MSRSSSSFVTRTVGSAAALGMLFLMCDCSSTQQLGFVEDDAGRPGTSFFEPEDEAGADGGNRTDAGVLVKLCIATDCPAPYATCTTDGKTGYACTTDLSNDERHCGACGNECPSYPDLFMRSQCVNGACVLECFNPEAGGGIFNSVMQNCNGIIDDGCEVNIFDDEKNCGSCGNVCAPGESCHQGVCGCGAPQIDCGGECVDVSRDMQNCGACGVRCASNPDGCNPLVPNTAQACIAGECRKYVCRETFADCNGDLDQGCASDGCETSLKTDTNCGACGIVCGAGTECRQAKAPVFGGPGVPFECLPICDRPEGCMCAAGEAYCPTGCADLLYDKANCGACSERCAGNEVCEKGICILSCPPGKADCNADPSDGCEVDTLRNPRHCGGCGNRCDTGAGQPCVDGQCLMKECDPTPTETH